MVATSEVSVSLTIDNTARTSRICEELSEFAEVQMESDQAIVCLVGDNIRYTPGVASHVFNALKEIEHSHDFAGSVAAESECCGGGARSAARGGGAACGILHRTRSRGLRMKIAIVGYGKMGRMIESLAPGRGIEIALKLDEFNNANFAGITRGELSGY